MPKIYSRPTISSDEQARITASSRAILRSYYCICGEFVLVMQGKLDRLPRRRTDGAHIIRSRKSADGRVEARKFKLSLGEGQRVLVRLAQASVSAGTKEKAEVRQQLTCVRCNSTVAYQTDIPPAGDSPFVYVLPGALTEIQGRIPIDALDGEPPSPPPPPVQVLQGEEPTGTETTSAVAAADDGKAADTGVDADHNAASVSTPDAQV